MCGRFVVDLADGDWRAVADEFALEAVPSADARFNLAPSQRMPALVWRGPDAHGPAKGPSFEMLTFGMQLGRSPFVINARAETLVERPMFRHLVVDHRILVVATAFYEWAPPAGDRQKKQPMCFAQADRTPFFFAALKESTARTHAGAAIVTTAANDVVRPSHARMPVMLSAAEGRRWLNPAVALDEALRLLQPFARPLVGWPVGPQVGNSRHDARDCIAPR